MEYEYKMRLSKPTIARVCAYESPKPVFDIDLFCDYF